MSFSFNPYTGNLDYYKLGIEKGTSLPTAGLYDGLLFHRTDIKTLFIYESGWKPVQSFGQVQYYVDKTNGTDAEGKGYSSGTGACKSITYAMNLIPPVSGGNVIVNITAEDYSETVVVRNKKLSGNFNILIKGTLPAATESGTSTGRTDFAMGSAGNGITQVTVTDSTKSWTVNAYANMLFRVTSGLSDGVERIIDSNTATVLTLVGQWPNSTMPAAGFTYEIIDLSNATTLSMSGVSIGGAAETLSTGNSGVFVSNTQNVEFRYINFENPPIGTNLVRFSDYASGSLTSCRLFHNETTAGVAPVLMQVDGYAVTQLISQCVFIEDDVTDKINFMLRYQGAAAPTEKSTIQDTKFYRGLNQLICAAGGFVNLANTRVGETVATGNGMVLRNARGQGFNVNSTGRGTIAATKITGCTNSAVTVSKYATAIINAGCELSNSGSHGVDAAISSLVEIGTGGLGTVQINNNGGYGISADSFSSIAGATNVSYTGNASGTYTRKYTESDTVTTYIFNQGSTGDIFELQDNGTSVWTVKDGGKMGFFGTTSPTEFMSFNGNSARTIWMERHTSANTTGNSLTVQAGGAAANSTNTSGGSLIFRTGLGTGDAVVNTVIFQACAQGTASGTTDQTLVNRLIINGTKTLSSGVATNVINIPLAPLQMAGGALDYTVEASDGTDMIAVSGKVYFTAVNKAGVYATNSSVVGTESLARSDGTDTLVNTFSFATATNAANFAINSVITGMTATTHRVTYRLTSGAQQSITLL